MDTWKSDRIYNWFGLAMGNSEPMQRKFFFDFSDNTFFDLIYNQNQYSISEEPILSIENTSLLTSKIYKVQNNDASILEIKKSKRTLLHLFDQTTSYENYRKREEEWNFLNEEIKTFLNTHSISIYEATLIE